MKRIRRNNIASSYPVVAYILCLALASFLILVLGIIVEPFMNLMDSSDDSIDSEISAPRGFVSQLAQLIWPKGLLLIIFLACSGAVIMEYQKRKYKEMG